MSMSNAKVSHAWAAFNFQSGTKPDASGSNFHYTSREVFSYITLIAQALPKRRVALFSATRYSPTTDRHMRLLARALPPDVKSLTVHSLLPFKFDESDIPQGWVKENVTRFQRAVYNAAALILKAKRNSNQRDFELLRAWGHYEEFCEEFDQPLEPVAILDKFIDSAFAQACRDRLEAAAQVRRGRNLAEIADNRTQAELIADWRSGKIARSYNTQLGGTLVRIHRGHVQTSLGISWPVAEAIDFWPLLCELRKKAALAGYYAPSNQDIKGFTVKYVTIQDITIGCHKLNWTELDAVAASLGLPAFTTT